MDNPASGPNTRLAHSGHDPLSFHGFVNPPVVRASTVLFPDAATLQSEGQRYTYATHGTPTTDALCAAISALEGAAGTVLTSSGLSAVVLPLLTFLSAGDHLLITDSVYGPTRRFVNEVLPRYGISVDYFAPRIGAGIARMIRPNTKVIFLETPGSNSFELHDVPQIVSLAKAQGVITMIDNSWATPLYFRPLDFGVDLSIHAATKYFSGHSDVLMGSVSANAATWRKLDRANLVFGHCVSGDDAYLVLRGLRTLGRRLQVQEASTLQIARWLQDRPEVLAVHHPALESHPDHAIWARDFKGSSSLFSVTLAPQLDPARFLDALQIFAMGYSYGGYESLAVIVDLNDRSLGAPDAARSLIRLHIGLEDVDDLIADLRAALLAAA